MRCASFALGVKQMLGPAIEKLAGGTSPYRSREARRFVPIDHSDLLSVRCRKDWQSCPGSKPSSILAADRKKSSRQPLRPHSSRFISFYADPAIASGTAFEFSAAEFVRKGFAVSRSVLILCFRFTGEFSCQRNRG
jgi:hypothetical protein